VSGRDFFSNLPKPDLHRHLTGSIRPETFIELVREYGIFKEKQDNELYSMVTIGDSEKSNTLGTFLKKFDPLRYILKSSYVLERIIEECIEDAKKDRVVLLELRFCPQYLAENIEKMNVFEIIEFVCEKIRHYSLVGLILTFSRRYSVRDSLPLLKFAARFLNNPVYGVDLAGPENLFPPENFTELFEEAYKLGFNITIHAGEEGPAEFIKTAVCDLHAQRIGHGINSIKDVNVRNLLVKTNTTLEICVSSNLQTGVVANLKTHPIVELYSNGVSVTLNTDDPQISKIKLSDEYMRVYENLNLTKEKLISICTNGFKKSFLNEKDKKSALMIMEDFLKNEYSGNNENKDYNQNTSQ